jgi:hypothetical protein
MIKSDDLDVPKARHSLFRGRSAKTLRSCPHGNYWMKFTEPRPYTDLEKTARRLPEIANTVEPVQDGRIHIEKVNWPFLSQDKASPAEYGAGKKLAIERGWLTITRAAHSCGSRRLVLTCLPEV